MSTDHPLRVFLVEDHFLMREGLKATLAGFEGLQVVGEATSGEEALTRLANQEADLALIDLGLPGIDGIELIARLKQSHPSLRLLALTVQEDQQHVLRTLAAGADGYCLKSIDGRHLQEAIAALNRGQAWLDPAVTSKVVTTLRGSTPAVEAGERVNLTEREQQILALIVEGLSNEQIAARLHLTVSTIKGHVNSLLRKLDVTDRVQAAVLALKQGYV